MARLTPGQITSAQFKAHGQHFHHDHRPPHDTYIARSAAFPQPILTHLRRAVHEACPEIEETTKWSMLFFVYRGRPLAHMAAFKQHCAFGF